MQKTAYCGIIFDCDGVLIKSRQANKRFYNLILEHLALPKMSSKQEEYVHCHTVQESLEFIVPGHLLDRAKRTAAEEISYKQVLPYITLQEGILDFLNLLVSRGIYCAVNTNRSFTMQLILEHFDLHPYFYPVITSQDVSHPKPDPESIFYILNSWNIYNKDVVFVGDSWVDEQTALSAGIEFWSYKNPGLQSASRYISDYGEALELIGNEKGREFKHCDCG